ncbi:glycosyl hydrolase family 8 [Demequina pelophila]|uniref:glycosyl hydrolase family 8 n=1 Tax=Demequina pelophila TaxID=1638984 RepID=UPI0007811F9A|nr:glycosyl hydrolase family 8 [Demequina pelophila]
MTMLGTRPRSRSHAVPTRSRSPEAVLIVALLVLSAVVHACNMLGYPYYDNDEATYMARGWALINEAQLDVVTYRYDHAPFGWILLGGWLGLTGDGALFGGILEAGRVFMLVVHVVNTLLVYVIGKRLSGGAITAGTIAALVFALSPLGIYFQRRILLDNLMAMWVLIGILLLLRKPLTVKASIGSGFAFGIAVLTKLNAAFFGVGFLVLLWAGTSGAQRKHAILNWFAAAGGTVLLFFHFAFLKKELLPAPVDENGDPTSVSLIDTFRVQLGRGTSSWPWDPASFFWRAWVDWFARDSVTTAAGVAAAVLLVLMLAWRRYRTAGAVALLALIGAYALFLARGGIVIPLYIVPLMPFLAIAVGMVAARVVQWLPRGWGRPVTASVVVLGVSAAYVTSVETTHLVEDETDNQASAVEWLEASADPDAIIVVDNYAYPELAQENTFTGAMYFLNAEYDPTLRATFNDDYRDIDYILLTHAVVDQIAQGVLPTVAEALEHSDLLASYTEGSTSFIDLPNYISTNGDWAQIWVTKSRNEIVLQDAWERFQDDWIVSYGQVLEEVPGVTTSEYQALAMEQALFEGDEATFRGVWQWTSDKMRHRQNDGLTSWLWESSDVDEGELGSTDTVCGVDQQFIALLARAGDRWGDPGLSREAADMLASWWDRCTFEIDGLQVVDSSADGSIIDEQVNTAHFNPVLYRELAQWFPGYDWQRLIDDGYTFLERVLEERGTIPNWVIFTQDGELELAEDLFGAGADDFGESTLRLIPTLIREELNGEERAAALLDALTPQLIEEAGDTPDLPQGTTLAMLALVRDVGDTAQDLYRTYVAVRIDPDTGTWDDSLYDFSWTYQWHRLQEDLPDTLTVPID